MQMKISFKLRLFFSYTLIILISFGLVAFFLDKNLEKDSLSNIQSSLTTEANLIKNQIPLERLKAGDSVYLEALANTLRPKAKCRITIINPGGRVLADSEEPAERIPRMENHLNRPEVKNALARDIGINLRYSVTLKINMLYVALPVKDGNETIGILRLALPLENVQKTLFGIRKIVLMGLLFALGFAFILGTLLAGRTIKLINRMIQVSQKYSQGDFSRRITRTSGDEIGQLAVALNQMAQGLEDKIKEIKTQNQELAAIFNSMVEGVIVTDSAGRIISINPTIEKIFGILKNETEGKNFLEAIRNNDISEVISAVLEKGKSVSTELTLVYPVQRIFEVNAIPIFENKTVSGCLAVIHDITEIRRLETVRRDFVANVSHELKTPLTSIKGFVETLLEGALEDQENNRNFLKIIRDHTDRINSLVDDLLSLSHLESKEIILDKKSFNLKQQVEQIISGFSSQLKKKSIEIKNELPAEILLNADKNRIEQVLTNLIDNAIKFNHENGSVKIYAQEIDAKIKIIVEDSGIGIPQKDLPRIFERFYRVDKARSRSLGGTGLGLSIVKHIIELHGGLVGVESTEGLGSKFFFTIPQ